MEEIKELTQEIRKLREDVHGLIVAVAGNDQLGQKGQKHVIADHESRILGLEQAYRESENRENVKKASEGWKSFRSKAVGFGVGASATATAMAPKSIWAKIWAAIQQFLNAST